MIRECTHYSLLNHNTFHIDVKAKCFIEYTTVDDLKEILSREHFQNHPYLHIGKGSNLLFMNDYQGTILHTAIMDCERTEGENGEVYLRVGAGIEWDAFVESVVKANLYGAENLSLIPGEVGAAAVQNIGAYGVEVKDLIVSVEAMEVATQTMRTFSNEACLYDYRQSIFKNELKGKYIVTHVNFKLTTQPQLHLEYGNIQEELTKYPEVSLATIRQAIVAIRTSKLPDPQVEGNAGSFFMNPIIPRLQYEALKQNYPNMPHYDVDTQLVKVPAGWLIEQAGWKGKSQGKAAVHDKQALVLVNKGGATGKEIVALSDAVCASVLEHFGIVIHPEVNKIGE